MSKFKTMVSAKTMGYLSDFYIECCSGNTDTFTIQEIGTFISNWLVENSGGFELPKWATKQAQHNYDNGQNAITALCESILNVAFSEWIDSQDHLIHDGMPGSDLVFHPVVVV